MQSVSLTLMFTCEVYVRLQGKTLLSHEVKHGTAGEGRRIIPG